MFSAWKKKSLEASGFRGITEEHIDKMAEELLRTGLTRIDSAAFTPEDLKRLEERLNREEQNEQEENDPPQ